MIRCITRRNGEWIRCVYVRLFLQLFRCRRDEELMEVRCGSAVLLARTAVLVVERVRVLAARLAYAASPAPLARSTRLSRQPLQHYVSLGDDICTSTCIDTYLLLLPERAAFHACSRGSFCGSQSANGDVGASPSFRREETGQPELTGGCTEHPRSARKRSLSFLSLSPLVPSPATVSSPRHVSRLACRVRMPLLRHLARPPSRSRRSARSRGDYSSVEGAHAPSARE